MRSYEERCAEMKRRIAARQREETAAARQRCMASAVAACLALLIGASLAMPGMTANIQTDDYSGFETAASMYGGSAALGYIIVIGLLAFFRRVHDHPVLPSAPDGAGGRTDEGKRGWMELIENLLQLLVTFAGALPSGICDWKSRAQKYFLLLCFYGCFALGALYCTLYLLLFDATPRVFYVSESAG